MAFDNVPRLIPLWNAKFINDTLKRRKRYQLHLNYVVDFGGAGVDIDWSKDPTCSDRFITPLKNENDSPLINKYPTLPFLPPVPIEGDKLVDPCCGELSKTQTKYENTMSALAFQKNYIKRKTYYDKLEKLYKELKDSLDAQEPEGTFFVPKNLMYIAENLPQNFPEKPPSHNMAYLGGTMAVCANKYLVHAGPRGHVVMTKILEDYEIDGSAKLEPQLDSQESLKIKDGLVHQVDVSHVAGQDYFLVRQEKRFHLFSLDGGGKPNHVFSREIESSYVKLSPHLPFWYLLCTKDEVSLRDFETKKIKWVEKCMPKEGWLTSDFGSSPRQITICQPDSLTLHDTRKNECKVVIAEKNPSLFTKESLRISWKFKDSYHYVGTDHHLFICDERYPEHPVLFWRHMFDSPPLSYASCQMATGAIVVALGTQATQQAGCYLFRPLSKGMLQSICTPWHAHSPLSVTKYFPNFTDRLGMPLTGVAVVPHQMSSGFTLFQQTSLGDVFSQSFQQYDDDGPPPLDPSIFEDNIWLRQEKLSLSSTCPSPSQVKKKLDEIAADPGKDMTYIDASHWFERKEDQSQDESATEQLILDISEMLQKNEISSSMLGNNDPLIELDPLPDMSDYEKDSFEQRIASLWNIRAVKTKGFQSPPQKKPRLDDSHQGTPSLSSSFDVSLHLFKTPKW